MKPSTACSLSCLALALSFLPPCFAAERGPSTPEERQRAVSIARRLEADPLNSTLRAERKWALEWLIQVPDIHVKMCTVFLGPVLDSKKNFASEIMFQMMLSQAAFTIEHPEKASDDLAQYAAGVEGSLKAYESILKSKPKARWPFLDELIQKRDSGGLPGYVKDQMEKCNAAAKVTTR